MSESVCDINDQMIPCSCNYEEIVKYNYGGMFAEICPYSNIKLKKAKEKTKMPPTTSITQRFYTDLRCSVGITTAIQLARFAGIQPPHLPQNHEIVRAHI